MSSPVAIAGDVWQAELGSAVPQVISASGFAGCGAPSARLRRKADSAYLDGVVSIDYRVSRWSNAVSYSAAATVDGKLAAEFVLRFSAQDDRLTVTCEFGEEHDGFELMGVSAPLISTSAERGGLAVPVHGGRLVDIAASDPQEVTQRAACSQMPLAAMLRHEECGALLELGSLDDNIVSSVYENGGMNRAGLSIRFTHRYGPQSPDVPSFKVTNRTDAFLTFFEAHGKHWWVRGAKMLRAKVSTSIPPVYDGAVIYKLKLDQPDFDETQFTTFDEALDRVSAIGNYTGGGRQVVYLNGWQHTGHDTGYPDVFTVNERLGGIEKLREAIQAGPRHNAIISFHDNYDDAYTNSPAWEDQIIATDEHGQPKAGGVWGGGQAYIISPHKYIERARQRIRKTVDTYGISKSIHIDVFSVVPDRYDFDPANPAGFARSVEAKNYIIRAFRELGLDMTSEGVCSAFAGNVNYGWRFPDSDERVFSAEEVVPVVPFIYHGRTIGAGGVDDDRHLLKHLLWGLAFCADIRKSTDLRSFIEKYYLIYVPFFQLASRTMQRYESENGWLTAIYDSQTWVRVNFDENRYEVVVDGITVAKDFSVTCPLPQGGWVIYSRDGGPASLPLPDGAGRVEVQVLSEVKPREFHEWEIAGGCLTLATEGGVPYRVSARQAPVFH